MPSTEKVSSPVPRAPLVGMVDWAKRSVLTVPTPGTERILSARLWLAPTSPFHTATEGGTSR